MEMSTKKATTMCKKIVATRKLKTCVRATMASNYQHIY